MAQRRDLWAARLPTFFKAQLAEASRGRKDGTRWGYYDVGFHLGRHHIVTFDLDDREILDLTLKDERTPTATLRRVLANNRHPEGDMVDYIPYKRRRAFLEGLVDGVNDESRYREQ